MKIKWDALLTVALIACALVTTSLVIRREFFESPAESQQQSQKPTFIKDWRVKLTGGVLLGPVGAQVQLVEFADFECPYCASFHNTLKAVRKRYPAQVSLLFVHFPLQMHRFAVPAARVAECAGEQGHFEEMSEKLFEGQGSFGLMPWSEYAAAAGVLDLPQFDVCIKKSSLISRVEQGRRLGTEIDVKATPTLIINGWKLGYPPTEQELDAMIKAVLDGKEPIAGARTS